MQLSQNAINEFKEIYFTEFGEDISDVEANRKGLKLLNLIKLIYRPMNIIDTKGRKGLDHYECSDDIK